MQNILTPKQIHIARYVSNLTVVELSSLLKINRGTMNQMELGQNKTAIYRHSPILIEVFNSYRIIFPNEFSIKYNDNLPELVNDYIPLTRFQLLASRSFFKINQKKLAKATGISQKEIIAAEKLNNNEFVFMTTFEKTNRLKDFFLDKNLIFSTPLTFFFKKCLDHSILY